MQIYLLVLFALTIPCAGASLPVDAPLSSHEWRECEKFIEKRAFKLFSKGTLLIPENKNLPCTLEYDPKAKTIYINLDTKKGGFIGEGGNKVVTKSIKYGKRPIIVARCTGGQTVISEGKILKDLVGYRGVIQFNSLIKHSNEKADLFLDYCDLGSLKTIELKDLKLSNQNLINIVLDLFVGLKTIHDKGYVHRDLHRSNILLKKNDRLVSACIADFGLSIGITEHPEYRVGVPNNTCPPEVLINEYKNIDRRKAEGYSIASIAYRLIKEENPIWADLIQQERLPEISFTKKLKTYHQIEKLYEIAVETETKRLSRTSKQIIEICLKMLHPDPAKRMYLGEAIDELLKL